MQAKSTVLTVMATGALFAAAVAGANGGADGPRDARRAIPVLPAAGMPEGQARYVRASGVDPRSARRAMGSGGRDLSVARAPGKACVVDTAGSALCADDADIAAGRALSFVACGPGMKAGVLRVTGLAPRDVQRATVIGHRDGGQVRDGAVALEVQAPRGGGDVRILLEGGARPIEAALDVPADLDDRPCGASGE